MRIFISHTSSDGALAEKLSQDLANAGFNIVRAAPALVPGELVAQRISEEIAKCDVVIALISKDYDRSKWAEFELAMAVYQRDNGTLKRILPILTSQAAALPPLLQGVLFLRADKQEYSNTLEGLVRALRDVESSATSGQSDMKWLSDQFEAIRLVQASHAQALRHQVISGSALAWLFAVIMLVIGGVLGLALATSYAEKSPPEWFAIASETILPVFALLLGYYFGSSKVRPESPLLSAGVDTEAKKEVGR